MIKNYSLVIASLFAVLLWSQTAKAEQVDLSDPI